MKKIILFTKMDSVRTYWKNIVLESYQPIALSDFKDLILFLDERETPITILFDELSVTDIMSSLQILKKYPLINLLLFNAVPEVYHASTLLNEGINGYENTFIAKKNLLKMIQCTKNEKKWLFNELIYFIINQYAHNTQETKLEFINNLTDKEKEISFMVADGLSNKDIARNMKIAISTVKGHIHHIFEKVGVSDRVALALKFK